MKTFEYKYEDIQDYHGHHERVFAAGEQGWELVSVIAWGSNKGQLRLYFKRPKEIETTD